MFTHNIYEFGRERESEREREYVEVNLFSLQDEKNRIQDRPRPHSGDRKPVTMATAADCHMVRCEFLGGRRIGEGERDGKGER